ncbi:hypothetical protein [Planktothrix sp. FACHB-1365]|uniref:hypothetical protein n=1 Tax=Planktothrix sp. FACHB-1365 TaxID=2692855 RepID=UPI001687C15C|nr:hypothetical protein [Planktothrix sp. FACHB-1365]MBD2481880.1 hypothetical protein [Planktothrix sp. FACHB-1365]
MSNIYQVSVVIITPNPNLMTCPERFCNWVRNSQDPDHYVCLRCDRQKRLNQPDSIWTFIILFAIAFIVVIAIA